MLGRRAESGGEGAEDSSWQSSRVHEPLSLREEAASEPCCSGSEAPQPSAWGEQGKQFMGRVGGACCDVHGSGSASADVDVL